MQFFQNIKTAAAVYGAVHNARKIGANAVKIQPVYTVPVVNFAPAYYNTIEGCLTHKLGHDTDLAVKEVFKSLPYEVQRQLEFTPQESGEWVNRTRFWQQQLKPVLPQKMYHEVMTLFIHWYAHCLRRRKEVTA